MDELKVWKEHGIFVLFILSSLYYYALMKDYVYCFFYVSRYYLSAQGRFKGDFFRRGIIRKGIFDTRHIRMLLGHFRS